MSNSVVLEMMDHKRYERASLPEEVLDHLAIYVPLHASLFGSNQREFALESLLADLLAGRHIDHIVVTNQYIPERGHQGIRPHTRRAF